MIPTHFEGMTVWNTVGTRWTETILNSDIGTRGDDPIEIQRARVALNYREPGKVVPTVRGVEQVQWRVPALLEDLYRLAVLAEAELIPLFPGESNRRTRVALRRAVPSIVQRGVTLSERNAYKGSPVAGSNTIHTCYHAFRAKKTNHFKFFPLKVLCPPARHYEEGWLIPYRINIRRFTEGTFFEFIPLGREVPTARELVARRVPPRGRLAG